MVMTQHVIEIDTLLPIAPVLVENLVTLAKAFADAAGVKITTVGTNSTKTASFYVDLEEGKTSCTLRKYDLLTSWFCENWPEGQVMPRLKDPRHYPSTAEGIPNVVKEIVRHQAGGGKAGRKEVSGKKVSGKKAGSKRGGAKASRRA
jgi:hypothetical protein